MIRMLIVFGILLYGVNTAFCQDAKTEAPGTGSCCRKQAGNAGDPGSPEIIAGNPFKKIIACKLTSPELQERKAGVIAGLKAKIIDRKELSDGFSYLFSATDENIDEVISFIKTERMCCDFFNFKIAIGENDLWLTITGEKGAKEFIADEIGL